MGDVGAFKNVSLKSEKLPDDKGKPGGSSHDCADLDYRFYQLVQKFEPKSGDETLGEFVLDGKMGVSTEIYYRKDENDSHGRVYHGRSSLRRRVP